jgi:hypothetical protein
MEFITLEHKEDILNGIAYKLNCAYRQFQDYIKHKSRLNEQQKIAYLEHCLNNVFKILKREGINPEI